MLRCDFCANGVISAKDKKNLFYDWCKVTLHFANQWDAITKSMMFLPDVERKFGKVIPFLWGDDEFREQYIYNELEDFCSVNKR